MLHPPTQAPLTIGIHCPWGKGNSSFFEDFAGDQSHSRHSEFFVFLGMDTEMIHRAIRVHYRKNQADEPLPADFPEN